MKPSKLRNKYLKSKSLSDRKTTIHNVISVRNFSRATKKEYFNNVDTKTFTDNRTFWKTDVPLFSNKNSISDKNQKIKSTNSKHSTRLILDVIMILC